MANSDPFGAASKLETSSGEFTYYSLPKLEEQGLGEISRLPYLRWNGCTSMAEATRIKFVCGNSQWMHRKKIATTILKWWALRVVPGIATG